MPPWVSLYWLACSHRTTLSPPGLHLSCSPVYPGPSPVLDTNRVLRNIYYLNEWWNLFSIPIILLYLSFNFPASLLPILLASNIHHFHSIDFKKKKISTDSSCQRDQNSSVWHLMPFTIYTLLAIPASPSHCSFLQQQIASNSQDTQRSI